MDKSPLKTLTLEDFLESERHKLSGTLTPVTPETFAKWKKERLDKKAAEDEARKAKEATGRAMFEQGDWEDSEEEEDSEDEDGEEGEDDWEALRRETERIRERDEEERIRGAGGNGGVGEVVTNGDTAHVQEGEGEEVVTDGVNGVVTNGVNGH